MCGRFSNKLTEEKLQEKMSKLVLTNSIKASYNIAPSHNSYIIKNNQPYKLSEMNWGVFPYGRTNGSLLINAKAETIFEKSTFKYSIKERRCLVLADSFYEWKKIGRDKMPYRVRLKDSELMVFGGIYNEWKVKDRWYSGFVILTTEPNLEMKKLHNRAPVILKSEAEQLAWISNISDQNIIELTQPIADESLHIYMVSNAVNKPINNSLDLHKEIPEQPTLF